MRSQTMKSCRSQLVSLFLAGLISMPAHAGVIPGRWEKVSALQMASPITVTLKNEDRIKGQLRGLSTSSLELLSPADRPVIPKTDIHTITLSWKDGLGDGAWIGAAVGAAVGAGFGGGIGWFGWESDGISNTEIALRGLIVAALSAGIGAVIGVAADAATKPEDIVLYMAPGTPRRSKHKDSEWWPPDPPEDEPEKPKISK